MGNGFICFGWTYIALQIPSGWLVDRVHPRLPFACILGLWSLATRPLGMGWGVSVDGTVRVCDRCGDGIRQTARHNLEISQATVLLSPQSGPVLSPPIVPESEVMIAFGGMRFPNFQPTT
jgi:hypothetical protein